MTATLLLWILILNASLEPSESHGSHGFEEAKDHEVVRPVRLHTVSKRQAENLRPQAMKYGMTLGGKHIEMQLEKNDELLTKDYTETYYHEDGTRVTTSPDDIDHCYYHGRIVNDSKSSVSLSTCDGLRGYFRTSAQRYLIEPLSGDDEGDHAVTTVTEKNYIPAVCGVTNTSWSDDFEPPTSRSRSRAGGISIVQQQKYLELFLVADNREYVKMKRDMTALRKRLFEVVNFVNMAYKPLRTFIALVGIEIWSNSDLISVTPPAGDNLQAFMNWRNSELVKRKKHDNAHLISGIDFEGPTVGLAFIGTLCSGHSVGVVQDHNDRAIAVGATLAHEMGHNLGMDHDDSSACSCSGDSCIMAASLSWNIPRTFSSCSGNNYEKYLMSRSPSCLLDKPDYKTVVAPSVCGNGFREAGEQCDCGTVQECTNPCCNATTCALKDGSQCADGECCENCKILPRSRECRRKQDDCDLAEYCDGTSNTCSEDVFAVNGHPCDGDLGYCYNGQCPRRPNQCIKYYGSGAIEAGQYCYNHNTRGVYYGFCKRPSKDQYIPCQREDVLCGKLYCHHGKPNPNYGRMVAIGKCKATFYDDFPNDYSLVDTGTICGDGKTTSITVNTMEENDSDPVHSESQMDGAFGPKTTPEETTSITVNTMQEDDSDPVHSGSLMDDALGPKTTPEETTSITVNTMQEDDSDPVHSGSLMDDALGPKTTPEETTSITVNTMQEDDSDPVHSGSLMDDAFGPKTTPEETNSITVNTMEEDDSAPVHSESLMDGAFGPKTTPEEVCSENQCVDLVTAYRNTNCSAKCPGHAVCNHRSECQCLPGWMPPSCISEDGDFSALSPGAVVAISVTIVLVVLGIILGVIGFMWKKRQTPILPTSHTQRKMAAGDMPIQRVNKGPAPGQVPQVGIVKPRAAPPPPPGGLRPKPPSQNYVAARQALRPVPPPKV